jgi:hypothetical protein
MGAAVLSLFHPLSAVEVAAAPAAAEVPVAEALGAEALEGEAPPAGTTSRPAPMSLTTRTTRTFSASAMAQSCCEYEILHLSHTPADGLVQY